MYFVHYYENKNLVLTQFVQNVPSVGQDIKIKGRKGQVSDVTNIDERNYHILVSLETKSKNKLTLDPKKKKR
ncbi:hypothetical protein [Fredinandcohnia sp. 179-A 10B2 NHS]|uniref:hypothetical protein n=1 Tax=Fredinandcohnia sp. 179-A 10B2 NHS TaxID=3235176 RepID=UPI0039A0803D